jgi:hypothetical protein
MCSFGPLFFSGEGVLRYQKPKWLLLLTQCNFTVCVVVSFYIARDSKNESLTWPQSSRLWAATNQSNLKVCLRNFWQGYHWIYGHIRCIHTILANPRSLVNKTVTKKENMQAASNNPPKTPSHTHHQRALYLGWTMSC